MNSNHIEPKVQNINLSKLLWKLQDEKEGKGWDESTCKIAEQEYRRFLTLKLRYPKQALVPNELIDTMWHQHILDTVSYRKDCDVLFGEYMDHYPYFGMHGEKDQEDLHVAFLGTQELYEKEFGLKMEDTFMRCGGPHKCHAPTSCACRAPGTCK